MPLDQPASPPPLTCDAAPEPITVPCPQCEHGRIYRGNHPGGGERCWRCDGAGVVPICCESCGEFGADAWFHGDPMHEACAARERIGAFDIREDA